MWRNTELDGDYRDWPWERPGDPVPWHTRDPQETNTVARPTSSVGKRKAPGAEGGEERLGRRRALRDAEAMDQMVEFLEQAGLGQFVETLTSFGFGSVDGLLGPGLLATDDDQYDDDPRRPMRRFREVLRHGPVRGCAAFRDTACAAVCRR